VMKYILTCFEIVQLKNEMKNLMNAEESLLLLSLASSMHLAVQLLAMAKALVSKPFLRALELRRPFPVSFPVGAPHLRAHHRLLHVGCLLPRSRSPLHQHVGRRRDHLLALLLQLSSLSFRSVIPVLQMVP